MMIGDFCNELNQRGNLDIVVTPARLIKFEKAGVTPPARKDGHGWRVYSKNQIEKFERLINNRPGMGRPKGSNYASICSKCEMIESCTCPHYKPSTN